MATFVLVHGAWAGSWIWKKVIPLLRAAGHNVYATTATGLGDRVHLSGRTVDLDTHIADVVNVLEFEDLAEVTLVGWSYGGMIITGVAERVPERLAGLVYLDALVPGDGQSGYDAEASPEEVRAADRAAAEAAGRPGFLVVGPYADWLGSLLPDPSDRAWVFAKLVAQPLATYTQPIRLSSPAATEVPRAFISCTEDKDSPSDVFASTAARLRSAPGWRHRELANNHLAPINDPRATADVLLSLV
ncbi:MAG TPA: alpha/beta hydrolase family protein [Microlunatus sp.]|nr:alpha/beta hydrolase family protein [Microlunatus sp.]